MVTHNGFLATCVDISNPTFVYTVLNHAEAEAFGGITAVVENTLLDFLNKPVGGFAECDRFAVRLIIVVVSSRAA